MINEPRTLGHVMNEQWTGVTILLYFRLNRKSRCAFYKTLTLYIVLTVVFMFTLSLLPVVLFSLTNTYIIVFLHIHIMFNFSEKKPVSNKAYYPMPPSTTCIMCSNDRLMVVRPAYPFNGF